MTANTRALWLLLAAAAWVAMWLFLSRDHLIDDTFIYMRYVAMSDSPWTPTFDGVNDSYGTSSYFYFFGLWVTRSLGLEWHLPKLASVSFHLGLLALVAWRWRASSGTSRIGYGLFGMVLISPVAFRWLGDGLETSLVLLVAAGLSLWWTHLTPDFSARRYAAGVSLGWLAFLLRPEFAVIIGALTAHRWLTTLHEKGIHRRRIPELAGSLHLLVGVLLGIITIWSIFGHVSPDTAIAKQSSMISPFDALKRMLAPMVSAGTFGLGLAGVWLLLTIQKLREGRWRLALTVGALPVALWIIVTLRGMSVQGIRHIAWAFIPPVIVALEDGARSLPVVDRAMAEPQTFVARLASRPMVVAAAVAALAAVWGLESMVTQRVLEGRSGVLRSFIAERAHYEELSTLPGVTYDLGFISYFTDGKLLDMNGLVHGRRFAGAGLQKRLARVETEVPDFLFVTSGQATELAEHVEMDEFTPVRLVEFTNVRGDDAHYLFVRHPLAQHFPPPHPAFPSPSKGGALGSLLND